MALTRPRASQIYDIDYKQATRVVTVSDITLSGGAPSLVDGVTLSVNDRVLVTGQTTASQNGVYFVSVLGTGSSGTWLRTTDTNTTGELLAGTIIMVTEGVTYHDTQWKLTTDDPITIGVTALTFVQNYSANSISAGTSNVSVTSNANVTVSSAGTANVLTVSNTGAYVSGVVSATGNTSALAGTFRNGDGQTNYTKPQITFGYNNTADYPQWIHSRHSAGVDYNNAIDFYTSDGTQNAAFTANAILGLTVNQGRVGVANPTPGYELDVTGTANVTGNILTAGSVSATGNITGSYILGNGSQLTGLPAGYANSNAVSYGEAGWAGNIVPSSNAVYSLGNATNQWKSLYVSNTTIYIGNVALTTEGNTLTVAGNTVVTSNSGNVDLGNLNVTGYVSATGNITGSYIIGNGSQLTGLPAGYANSNVAEYLASGTDSSNIITTANISGSYILGNGSQLTGLPAGYGNANLANIGSNSISTTGNISSGYFIGNGSTLSSITGSNVTGTVANATYATSAGSADSATTAGTVTTAAQPNITSVGTLTSVSVSGNAVVGNVSTAGVITATGNVTGGNLVASGAVSATGAGYFGDGLSVIGNITATGNINYQNVTDLVVGDPLIYIGANNTADLVDLGIVASANVANIYQHLGLARNHTTGVWGLFGNVVAEPTTVIDWANAVYQPFLSGTISSTGNVSATGNITGGNVLTDGLVSATGNITGNYILGNGSQLTGITTDAFRNILVSGQSNIQSANTPNIAFVAGTDIAITTDAANGTITFNYASSSSIFATGGDMGSVASAVTSSEDLGSVTDSATVFYDLGSVANDGSYTTLSVTGNTTTGNLLTGGIVSATGNIQGNYILGNGSQLTGISAGSSNNSITITVTTISANTTIAAGQNGFSVGPMSTADGVTVTIADGQRWVII